MIKQSVKVFIFWLIVMLIVFMIGVVHEKRG